MRDDDGGAGWQQHYQALHDEAQAREEFARAVRLAARLGNHPVEEAAGLERALLTYAGLPIQPERNPNQHTLNI